MSEMKRVECEGVGDNNGFFVMEVPITMSQPKSNEEIAQYVIDNRYPKNELDKVSDVELYQFVLEALTQKDAEVAEARTEGINYVLLELQKTNFLYGVAGKDNREQAIATYRKIRDHIKALSPQE